MAFGTKVLLLGKDGQVGSELQRVLHGKYDYVAVGRESCDLEKASDIKSCLEKYKPEVIINAAAYTNVDGSESDPQKAMAINCHAVSMLAEFAAKSKSVFVHYSTDYVYDGNRAGCWTEHDLENPINEYGKSKLRGDNSIRVSGCRHLIIRSSWIYSAFGNNFAKAIVRKSIKGESIGVISDTFGVPTSGEFLAEMSVTMIDRLISVGSKESLGGTYNVVPKGVTTWYEYAKYLLQTCRNMGVPVKTLSDDVKQMGSEEYILPAKRPKNSTLCIEKLEKNFGVNVPDWKVGTERFVNQMIQMGQKW
jgi:dTDP-4-dehydrorhamnose reductase